MINRKRYKQRVKLLELKIKPKGKRAREITSYRASICHEGWADPDVLRGEAKGGR